MEPVGLTHVDSHALRTLYEAPYGSGRRSRGYFPNKVEFIPHQSKGCLDEGCDCAYDGTTVDVQSCGYQPKKHAKRTRQLEWEHVVPAEAFGQSFPEWREGHPECVDRKGKAFKGRNCAAKMAVPFRYMEADLYNLQPAIGEVNQLRSNYSMAMIDGEARTFGTCDLEIEDRKIEPRPDIRGDIARTYLYMDAAYPGRGVISEKNRKLFEAWDREDPVDTWERERVRRIEQRQGNPNPFVP
jgi:deoxyribonuclease-1